MIIKNKKAMIVQRLIKTYKVCKKYAKLKKITYSSKLLKQLFEKKQK